MPFISFSCCSNRVSRTWKSEFFFNSTSVTVQFETKFESVDEFYNIKVKKVKVTLVQALRLCTGRTAHRGSRGIALLFRDHCTRRGEGSALRPGRSLPPGKTRYPLYRRLWSKHVVLYSKENSVVFGQIQIEFLRTFLIHPVYAKSPLRETALQIIPKLLLVMQ